MNKKTIQEKDNKIKSLENEISEIKQNFKNDSILLSEYQEALDQYMETDPMEADKFMKIIEKINEYEIKK